jgi:hypothetical protein
MPLSDSQMDTFEAHFHKKTKRRCPMCGGRKFEFSMNPLGMFRVDARAAVKIPDIQQGRVLVFVNCKFRIVNSG